MLINKLLIYNYKYFNFYTLLHRELSTDEDCSLSNMQMHQIDSENTISSQNRLGRCIIELFKFIIRVIFKTNVKIINM